MGHSRADLLIIGGGISGAALLFAAARYTSIQKIVLIEKYPGLARTNTAATHNSQTLHCGDIETNYTLAKALKVKRAAQMVMNYARNVAPQDMLLHRFSKMVLGVGENEVTKLRARFTEFGPHYEWMRLFEKNDIARIEPNVVKARGGERPEPIMALGAENEICAANFAQITNSFATQARRDNPHVDIVLATRVTGIEAEGSDFRVETSHGSWSAGSVVVSAGGHSLFLAQQMGYGLEYTVLPVAGSFYFAPKVLNGKVYTVQNDKLPFAAIHGDPDLLMPDATRFGPTALILPELERYRWSTIPDFLRVMRLDGSLFKVLGDMFADSDIRNYIIKNTLFEVPLLRHHLFARDAQKIVPTLTAGDLKFASGFGGLRPQLVDRKERKLLMGEAKINPGNGIIFNMTPSPGATSCLDNAEQDLRFVLKHLGANFNEARFKEELEGK